MTGVPKQYMRWETHLNIVHTLLGDGGDVQEAVNLAAFRAQEGSKVGQPLYRGPEHLANLREAEVNELGNQ